MRSAAASRRLGSQLEGGRSSSRRPRSRRSSGAAMWRAISAPANAPSRAATIRPIQSGAVTWGMKKRILVSLGVLDDEHEGQHSEHDAKDKPRIRARLLVGFHHASSVSLAAHSRPPLASPPRRPVTRKKQSSSRGPSPAVDLDAPEAHDCGNGGQEGLSGPTTPMGRLRCRPITECREGVLLHVYRCGHTRISVWAHSS